jgi:rRNA maturation endonuclease Nob1
MKKQYGEIENMDYCPKCFIQVTYIDEVCPCCGSKIIHKRTKSLEKIIKSIF